VTNWGALWLDYLRREREEDERDYYKNREELFLLRQMLRRLYP
jgi:hypothetical protein